MSAPARPLPTSHNRSHAPSPYTINKNDPQGIPEALETIHRQTQTEKWRQEKWKGIDKKSGIMDSGFCILESGFWIQDSGI